METESSNSSDNEQIFHNIQSSLHLSQPSSSSSSTDHIILHHSSSGSSTDLINPQTLSSSSSMDEIIFQNIQNHAIHPASSGFSTSPSDVSLLIDNKEEKEPANHLERDLHETSSSDEEYQLPSVGIQEYEAGVLDIDLEQGEALAFRKTLG
jgi:hypothetical protein